MEVNVGKKSTQISLDISPLFFHIVSKLVQALPPQPCLSPLGLSRVWQTGKTFLDLGFESIT
jgi:hypothetical protein